MSLSVKLEAFEGPLDLLLYLIDREKINIYDIPIIDITKQYLDYIHNMECKDMDVMSEFLVMAATIIRIKSQMLLPVEKTEEAEAVDPRQELVERLLEYKMYKYISMELKDKQIDAAKMMFKLPTIPDEVAAYKEEIDVGQLLSDVTLAKLDSIFQSVIKKKIDKIDPVRSKFGRIEKEEFNLNEKIYSIQSFGLANRKFSFRRLLENQADRMEIIVTFLAVLELIKMGRISIVQEELFDDITIEYLANDIVTAEQFTSII